MSLRIDTSQALHTHLDLHELLLAVEQAAAEDESDWIEWKSAFDLSGKSTRVTLARHIIGMANRRVEEAKRLVEGFGYILVGVEPGSRCGVTPVDFADLRAGIASYLGPHGPRWTGSYDTEDGPPVLIVTVYPPCDGDPMCPFTGVVHWRQLMAGSGGSQGFPAMALLMASSAVMP